MDKVTNPSPLEKMIDRYNSDDPTLTAEEINDLRRNVAAIPWMEMQKARIEREEKRNVIQISAGRTDQQKAEECRARLLMALAPVADILTEAAKDGLLVNFQFGQPDSFKRVALANLEILKKLC